MRLHQILIALISLVVLGTVVYWEYFNRRAPGMLHPSHASVGKLQGNSGCVQCHGEGNKVMADACEVCHKEIKVQIDKKTGVHGNLPKGVQIETCAKCHSEHNGMAIPIVAKRSFILSGVGKVEDFDHAKVCTYTLKDKHLTLRCIDCHPQAQAMWLNETQKRYIGLSQACESCHKDVHNGTFGPDCQSCHGQSKEFKVADGFVHPKSFPLVAGHGNSKCETCHEPTGATSVASLMISHASPRTCAQCHTSPHKPSFVDAVARTEHVTTDASCVLCHGRDDASFLYPVAKLTPAHHELTGFSLALPHDKTECIACHKEIGKRPKLDKGADLMTRFASFYGSHAQTACGDCHASPHVEKVVAFVARTCGAPANQACAECHGVKDAAFLHPVAKMTAAQHAATGFSLTSPHDKVECIKCHKEIGHRQPLAPGSDLPQRFAKFFPVIAQEDCQACHVDPHKGQFAKSPSGGRCVACHEDVRFTPSTFDLVAHEKTRLPLTGAHRAIACTECHKIVDKIQRFVPTASQCLECHADVHKGMFDQPGRPAKVDGHTDCERCHGTARFDDVTWKPQDHLTWTGYALVGDHATAKCETCHAPAAKPDEHGRSFGWSPTACVACHQDVHAGQFVVKDLNDCARCHDAAKKFKETTFDHQRDSSFKLDDVHAKLDCKACHLPVTISKDVQIVRYKALGTQCQDCHGTKQTTGKEGT